MTELFDDEDEDKVIAQDDESVDEESIVSDSRVRQSSDARRRLEKILEDRRLRDELEDFPED